MSWKISEFGYYSDGSMHFNAVYDNYEMQITVYEGGHVKDAMFHLQYLCLAGDGEDEDDFDDDEYYIMLSASYDEIKEWITENNLPPLSQYEICFRCDCKEHAEYKDELQEIMTELVSENENLLLFKNGCGACTITGEDDL